MTKGKTGATRALNVQVPGAEPKVQPETAKAAVGDSGETEATTSTAPDLEAMREQIRAEERANITQELRFKMMDEAKADARAELAGEMQAAMKAGATVLGEPVGTPVPTTSAGRRNDYANMRASQIDPATLTAPVMTKDGWLCPLPPEPKK